MYLSFFVRTKRKPALYKMRENPAISDWVHISGGSTEGLLGGWLAQRQAALRGVLAAGARSTLFVSSVRAGRYLSTSCATKTDFWNSELIESIGRATKMRLT